jgi:glyceraldehyde-3-phosphate dehydrogenase (NAD(P))
MASARAAVVGYGVVGKRVADAVHAQSDMDLVGVVDVVPSDLVRVAAERGYPIYAGTPDAVAGFQAVGIEPAGTIDDILGKIDIAVDCSPPGVTAKNVERYKQSGTKYIVQGGEAHSLTDFSFNAFANYKDAIGRTAARVVSCNTTSECRLLSTLDRAFGVVDAFIAITRRGVDPVDIKKGPINATVPALPGFSHHAPDVQTIMPQMNVRSLAVVASTTLMHVHMLRLQLREQVTPDSVRDLLAHTPRSRLVSGKAGIASTAHIIEWARDMGRPRNDHWEIAIWDDSIVVDENGILYLLMAVHMESVIAPDNVDCIRAMCELEPSARASIAATDRTFGIERPEEQYAVFE